MSPARIIAITVLFSLLPLLRAQRPSYPASLQSFQIPVHASSNSASPSSASPGSKPMMNAFVYVAAGAGPHPVVVLLHGFPGNERNLDLAQDMRRAGWDVLYFDYRGTWGSPGDFSFSHSIEDTAAAVDYLRTPELARILRIDPERVVLLGYSMGGFAAVQAAAADPRILGLVLISAADYGGRVPQSLSRERQAATIAAMSAAYEREGMAPLAGCTAEGLAHEVLSNAQQWSFASRIPALKTRPALIVTSNDAYARGNQAFAAALRRAGDAHVETLHLPTDHAYSDQRNALSSAVLKWLASLPTRH